MLGGSGYVGSAVCRALAGEGARVAFTYHRGTGPAAELKRDASFALGILRRRPFQALLQVTNRCNMTCGFCDFRPNGALGRVGTLGEVAAFAAFLVSERNSYMNGEPILMDGGL